ncbi:hypothetical protein DPMN_050484 [Dreissena polymorpha]|uniref:Uncharacterized protein n=1 Tax=Dreissena polymorpha TaxID=45954 RepID=A0A9D4HN19_DREPO|nr:hypothetical protein DPMN_050484 [Dreissena polymorpha]
MGELKKLCCLMCSPICVYLLFPDANFTADVMLSKLYFTELVDAVHTGVRREIYTYIMFNYDQEQFSIRPLPDVPVASGYTHVDFQRTSIDGFISLDVQPLYNQYGGENASEWTSAVQNHSVMAPLWTNIDSRNITDSGLWIHVFTDHQKDKVEIPKIQDLIHTNQTELNVSVALVATWKHVTVHSPYEPGYELV